MGKKYLISIKPFVSMYQHLLENSLKFVDPLYAKKLAISIWLPS